MSEIIDFFSKLLLVVANVCNLQLFVNIFVCMVLTDLLTQIFSGRYLNKYTVPDCHIQT